MHVPRFGDATGLDLASPAPGDRSPKADWFFARLPPAVADGLTPEQKTEIARALDDPAWSSPPVNIRLGIPLPGRRCFITLVGGVDKRGPARRSRDRHRYPLRTLANVFFFLGMATLFYAAAMVLLAFQTAIVEF